MDYGRIWAEIDLDAFEQNLTELRRLAGPCRLLLAVKAEAYGHGLTEIAKAAAAKVDMMGVASVEEGISIRRAGIATPVLILSPVPDVDIPALFEHQLTPAVSESAFAERLAEEASHRHTTIGLHVEVDTGMGRTGIDCSEAAAFISRLVQLPGIRVEGIFTHFPAADSDIEFSQHQLDLYAGLQQHLEKLGVGRFLRHAANTAGLLNIASSRLDLVRPGLIAYGVLPDSYHSGQRQTDIKVKPVMSLRSRIVNLRRIPAGRSISYERSYFTKRNSLIAVITAGYGDGYPWSLRNRGAAIVRGRRAPIVGSVCMDLTMLDVTDIPEISLGDSVTLLGTAEKETITANELAEWAGTIPYEIICRVSPRVPRIYLRDNKVVSVRTLLGYAHDDWQHD